jgi:prolyl-tRNA editing enzyme YbaK/EbsC (Cys-tRNA(Pro) deacylase)
VPAAAGVEQRVRAHLDRLAVAYETIPIDPALADTADFCAHYGYPLEVSCNCIVVAGKTGPPRHAACVVQATRRLDVNRRVRRLLGVRKASFASTEETEAITGMTSGGVTPLALPGDLAVYVDAPIMRLERLILGGGSRSLKIAVAPEVFERLPSVTIVEDLSIPA